MAVGSHVVRRATLVCIPVFLGARTDHNNDKNMNKNNNIRMGLRIVLEVIECDLVNNSGKVCLVPGTCWVKN